MFEVITPCNDAQFAGATTTYTGTAGTLTGWKAGPTTVPKGVNTWMVSAIQVASGGSVYAKPCQGF